MPGRNSSDGPKGRLVDLVIGVVRGGDSFARLLALAALGLIGYLLVLCFEHGVV